MNTQSPLSRCPLCSELANTVFTGSIGDALGQYACAGISRNEMICLLHLATHHAQQGNCQASCSMKTLANLMGYRHENSARRLIRSLRDKGLLRVVERPGKVNIYIIGVMQDFAQEPVSASDACGKPVDNLWITYQRPYTPVCPYIPVYPYTPM